jgi:hypothetical protein
MKNSIEIKTLQYENGLLKSQYRDLYLKFQSLEQKLEILERFMDQKQNEWKGILLKYDIPAKIDTIFDFTETPSQTIS